MRWANLWVAAILCVALGSAQVDAIRSVRSIDLNEIYPFKVRPYRLPKELRPTSYQLELHPFINEAKFKGRVKINVTWVDTSDRITLNVHPELQIINSSVRVRQLSDNNMESDPPASTVNIARMERHSRRPWYIIHLEQMLKNGSNCEVDIMFSGNITTNETSGFFKNEYTDSDGRKQFGETDLMRDHFAKTPEMSTHQLALVISDLEFIEPTQKMNERDGKTLEIKVWGRKEYLNILKDVPDKIVRIMNYLQDYFNSSIVLPKLDVMAIPMYNAAKPSDSWGLMFFKESELSSPLIWNTAYELIHQWIGQYMTPFGWSDTPTNKALNSFLASMTTFNISPDEMEGKWPMNVLYSLYYEFGKTFPFSRVAGIRHEATSAKTFRLVGEQLRSPRTFFADDIYSRLNDVANETNSLPSSLTINSIAAPWINRDRVPLVTVIRDYETGSVSLSQKVYLREAPPPSTDKVSYQWDIPIVMLSQDKLNFSNTKPLVWLTKSNEPKNLTIKDITAKENFLIVNPEEIGMFPVNYDSCNWKMLSQYLQGPDREKIPVLTRAKLLHDAWNLAYAGELCFGIALNMTLFLKEERSHVVWEPVFTMIDHIGKRIEGSPVYPRFEAYIRSLLKPLYMELGETPQPDEPSWKGHMRALTKNFLCRAGYKPCVAEAREQYQKWLNDEEPDKGNPVANEFICPVFKWGSKQEWEFGLQRVINFPQNTLERKQSERTYLLKTLAGCPKDTYKIERLLNATILNQDTNFTDSDIHLIFSMLTGGSAGYTTLFNFLADHWDIVKQRFENKKHLWDGIVHSATSSFNTRDGYDMVMELYLSREGEFESASTIIAEALKNIKQETKWSEKNVPVIESWLNENLSKEDLEAANAMASEEDGDSGLSSADESAESNSTVSSTTVLTTIVTPILG